MSAHEGDALRLQEVDVKNFVVDCILNNSMGRIANMHKVWADRWGRECNQAIELVALHSKAVDFAKTGVPAIMPKCVRAHGVSLSL